MLLVQRALVWSELKHLGQRVQAARGHTTRIGLSMHATTDDFVLSLIMFPAGPIQDSAQALGPWLKGLQRCPKRIIRMGGIQEEWRAWVVCSACSCEKKSKIFVSPMCRRPCLAPGFQYRRVLTQATKNAPVLLRRPMAIGSIQTTAKRWRGDLSY